jgi:hypothetical protein
VSPTRARVSRYAASPLESRFGLVLDAARLDCNVFWGRVALSRVRLAARGHEETPFFTADAVRVARSGAWTSGR